MGVFDVSDFSNRLEAIKDQMPFIEETYAAMKSLFLDNDFLSLKVMVVNEPISEGGLGFGVCQTLEDGSIQPEVFLNIQSEVIPDIDEGYLNPHEISHSLTLNSIATLTTDDSYFGLTLADTDHGGISDSSIRDGIIANMGETVADLANAQLNYGGNNIYATDMGKYIDLIYFDNYQGDYSLDQPFGADAMIKLIEQHLLVDTLSNDNPNRILIDNLYNTIIKYVENAPNVNSGDFSTALNDYIQALIDYKNSNLDRAALSNLISSNTALSINIIINSIITAYNGNYIYP
jgi:hypothetical protein